MIRGFVVVLLFAAPMASQTQAQNRAQTRTAPVERAQPLERTADFWREVRAPGTRRAETLLKHGLRFMFREYEEAQSHEPRPHVRAAFVESAIVRFELARRHAPHDARVLFELGSALARFERPARGGPPERRDREAIAVFRELQALDDDYNAELVGFELGVLHSRLAEHEQATEAYEHALVHSFDERRTSVTHSNLAETRMMAGDLNQAVHHYELAIRAAETNLWDGQAQSLALGRWGLAIALDRLGEHHSAIEAAQAALSVFGGSMSVLREDGVFFDPPSEIHYYEALGHMARAERLNPPEAREALGSAQESWRAYLALSGDEDPWKALAERHARAVRRKLAQLAVR